jgi:hypothetical protein
MLLLIFGIYVLATANCTLSSNYGLKGTGARVAGGLCIAMALGFFSIFTIPIVIIASLLDLGSIGVYIISFLSQLVLLAIMMVVLVKIYGNGYAK